MSLRALLFDLDGTLADTERLGHRPAYNRAFKKLGLQWRWGPKLYRKLLSQPGGRERLRHYLKSYRPELGEHADAISANADAWVADVHALKSRYFRWRVRRGKVPLRPGVARVMQEARGSGIAIGIVTNASQATIKALLEHSLGADLAGHLDVVVGGDAVVAKKPAPDIYLAALARLGIEPGECLAVEDSGMGLQAARAAGVPTIITTNPNTEHENFEGALLVLDGLGEPAQPPRVLAGSLGDQGCVTIEFLRALLAQRTPPPHSQHACAA